MNKEKDKLIYRIISQTEGITVTAETKEMTMDVAKKIAKEEVLNKGIKTEYQPFVVLPVTTQERWDAGSINFCPRCGTNINDYELEGAAYTDCHTCGASLDIQITVYEEE